MLPLSFGVFQNYYKSVFASQALIALTGTVCSVSSRVLRQAPIDATAGPRERLRSVCLPFDRRLLALSKLRARLRLLLLHSGDGPDELCDYRQHSSTDRSFLTFFQPLHILMAQGVLYNIGLLFLVSEPVLASIALNTGQQYVPTISLIGEWFVQKRGLALGLVFACVVRRASSQCLIGFCSGCGIGAIVGPTLLTKLLGTFGFRTTFRAFAVFFALSVGAILPFIRARLPVAKVSLRKSIGFENFKRPALWLLLASNFLQGASYFLPSLYLYTQATSLGISVDKAATLLTLFAAASAISKIALGALSDSIMPWTLMTTSSILSAVTILTIWGFASSYILLCVFAVLFALFAGGYASVWTWAAASIVGKQDQHGTNSIVGFCSTFYGLGAMGEHNPLAVSVDLICVAAFGPVA
jgi:hypothetical protein